MGTSLEDTRRNLTLRPSSPFTFLTASAYSGLRTHRYLRICLLVLQYMPARYAPETAAPSAHRAFSSSIRFASPPSQWNRGSLSLLHSSGYTRRTATLLDTGDSTRMNSRSAIRSMHPISSLTSSQRMALLFLHTSHSRATAAPVRNTMFISSENLIISQCQPPAPIPSP